MTVSFTPTELLLFDALYHLRYLSTEQITQKWFSERGVESTARRLRKLRARGLLESSSCNHPMWSNCWRLGSASLPILRQQRFRRVDPYPPLKPMFLAHLLDTNSVFLALSQEEEDWDNLAFSWAGSHRSIMRFASLEDRRRSVTPDALISVHSKPTAPRVFLELDRSTEPVAHINGRRTIESKLTAYAALLNEPLPGESRTPYAAIFGDSREPRVLFALAKDDRRAKAPSARNRRMRSIYSVASKVGLEAYVQCVYLRDAQGLRVASGLETGSIARALTDSGIRKLHAFYHDAVSTLRKMPLSDETRARLSRRAREAKRVLQDLGRERVGDGHG